MPRLLRVALLVAFVVPAMMSVPARADILRSPEHLAFIRLALTNPQIVVHRDEAGKFQIEQCRCPVPVTLKHISKFVPQALIATEDKDFRASPGIELKSIMRAVFLAHGRQGGSGLHQQIAKNLIVGAAPTYARKAQEALDALAIDGMFSKDQILEIYLNNMNWGTVDGHAVIGIEQASRAYFGKSAAGLDLYEAAALVGMLNGPTRYSLIHHADRAQQRTEFVLGRMQTVGFIDAAHVASAAREGRRGVRRGPLKQANLMTVYYTAWVRQALDGMRSALEGQDRLRVVLGLDLALQENAEHQMAEMLHSGRAQGASQGAMVAMDSDGLVRAMVGGGSFSESQLDRVTMAHRQPGSAFKPFVYLRALEMGRKPTDHVLDAPLDGTWPRNFDRRYNGNVTLGYALAHSLNGATARLANGLGLPGIVELAHRMGIASRLEDKPSLALGTYEVTPMELTSAFATIANDGRRAEPHGILAIATAEGDVISLPPQNSGPQVVAAERARVLTGMLREVVASGTGYTANYGPGAVGKTGTTQDERDAWFVGFDRDSRLVLGVWVGNDDNAPMRDVTGTTLPAAAWRRLMVASGRVRTQKVMTVSR